MATVSVYNMQGTKTGTLELNDSVFNVEVNEHLETCHKGLYVIGDGSGITHSLSHASASGVYVARDLLEHI